MMMEQEMQLIEGDMDPEVRTMIPSPNPVSGQEIVEYLNENRLTIVDIKVIEEKKKLDGELKELRKKENELVEEKRKLECQKDFYMKQHGKYLECIRKVAELTGFHRLKQSPSKVDSKYCGFELVREELLNKFCEHVENKFGGGGGGKKMKKEGEEDEREVPVKLVEPLPKSKVVVDPVPVPVVKSSPKCIPVEAPTMSMTSGSGVGDKPKEYIVKKNLSPTSNIVQAINRKLKRAALPAPGVLSVPKVGSSKAILSSSSSALSVRSKGSTTKWRCDNCTNRVSSSGQFKEHRRIVERVLGDLKEHNQSFPVFLPKKKSRKFVTSPMMPTASPVPTAVTPIKAVVLKVDERSFLSLSSSDEDMPAGTGAPPSPKIPEAVAVSVSSDAPAAPTGSGAGNGNCCCHVCGDVFWSMATLNFHIRKKHTSGSEGGPME